MVSRSIAAYGGLRFIEFMPGTGEVHSRRIDLDPATKRQLNQNLLLFFTGYGLSLTLGTADMKLLEHLEGYTVFANEGIKRDARAILEVKDSKGEVLKKKEDNKGKRVWDEKEIYALNWILCDLGGFRDQPQNQYYLYNGRRAYCQRIPGLK